MILGVFGATGQQGGSVIDYILNDSDLSQRYQIRAITRDVHSENAQQLKKKKVEIVHGDVLNRTSLEAALIGVHTIFAMTPPAFGPDGLNVEINSAISIADTAVEKGVEYIIFSTLPPIKEISGGKYTKITPFDAKAQAEQYIRGLPIKSAFYSPGSFMENFKSQTALAPRQSPDGTTWIMGCHTSPKTRLPLIDAIGDTGKFVGSILTEPEKYAGKTFHAAIASYSLEEICAIMSKAAGKTVVYKQILVEDFKKGQPFEADMFAEYFSYLEEFGYFGPESEKLIAWAAEKARGRLSTLEEYMERHPLRLE